MDLNFEILVEDGILSKGKVPPCLLLISVLTNIIAISYIFCEFFVTLMESLVNVVIEFGSYNLKLNLSNWKFLIVIVFHH